MTAFSCPRLHNHTKGRLGFTLLELLTVIAIVAILSALLVPAVGPLLRSSSMNEAQSMMTDELDFARQYALTRNQNVAVRIYLVGSKSNATDQQYRAFRTFLINDQNPTTSTPLDKIKYLPESVIISSGKDANGDALSTLLDTTKIGPTSGTDTSVPGATSTPFIMGPDDFAAFWRSTYDETLSIPLNLAHRKIESPRDDFEVHEIEFDASGGFRIGEWVSVPTRDPVEHGFVVGHGYGGR